MTEYNSWTPEGLIQMATNHQQVGAQVLANSKTNPAYSAAVTTSLGPAGEDLATAVQTAQAVILQRGTTVATNYDDSARILNRSLQIYEASDATGTSSINSAAGTIPT